MSATKRLTVGLGIMVLGFCAALPFRKTTSTDLVAVSVVSENPVTLGDDVPLQVPGQTIAHLQQPGLQEWPAPNEAVEEAPVVQAKPRLAKITPPPALPDQYRPLFPPGTTAASGIVRSPGAWRGTASRFRRHTIHDGDTLESLALRYLGDPRRGAEILAANAAILGDPEVLPIGVEIRIPRRDTEITSASSRAPTVPTAPLLEPLPTRDLRPRR